MKLRIKLLSLLLCAVLFISATPLLCTCAAALYYGDTDGDGLLSAADARTILRVAVSLEQADTSQYFRYDMDCDGNVTAADARLALRTAVGLEQAVKYTNIAPPYTGSPYTEVNSNKPSFTPSDYASVSYEHYSPLDSLGRCGTATALIGKDLMPTEERENISSIKPTAWHSVSYDIVEGYSLYNRCHLIGFQLTGENANEKNLITGTRYLNTKGMLPFENMVADYVKETGNHVLYRVTPFFEGNNLLASGVLMEGISVEDNGEDICFCAYAYNVQPGINLNYADGSSSLASEAPLSPTPQEPDANDSTYVLNTSTKKYHLPSCASVATIKEQNKGSFTGDKADLITQGYAPCKKCNP